jgi:protocatechuate 3,4-dioxygenase beta subunit
LRKFLSRRVALAGITGSIAALASRGIVAQTARCALTADSGEGPFYFDANRVRADVTENAVGAPLEMTIRILRADECAPFPGARVDLWQADALGLYSGYREQSGVGGISTRGAVDRTYLRGTQLADAEGWVRFRTIYPSWYGGRTPHIHVKVLLDADELTATQIFFPDEINAEVFSQWDPYREHVGKRRVFNHDDRFLDTNADGRIDGVFCAVERFDRSGLSANATITVRDRT